MMKYCPIAVLSVVLCTTTAISQESTGDNRALLEELRGIRTSLDRIADELSQLRKTDDAKERLSAFVPDWSSIARSGPNVERLAKITIPEDATEAEAKQYIDDILDASKDQKMWSDRDPQIGMLAKVGSENLPLLVEALDSHHSKYHIVPAIVRLSDERNASLILDALPIHHELIKVIIKEGWENRAKQTLIDEVKNTTQYLPSEWLVAVANLDDPTVYPLLRDYFISGPNKHSTYAAIKYLPVESLDDAVSRAWKMSQYEGPYGLQHMAAIAAAYGHIDAIAVLIDVLQTATDPSSFASRETRPTILKHVSFRGSNEELYKWFTENRDRLVFDKHAKKFIIRD